MQEQKGFRLIHYCNNRRFRMIPEHIGLTAPEIHFSDLF